MVSFSVRACLNLVFKLLATVYCLLQIYISYPLYTAVFSRRMDIDMLSFPLSIGGTSETTDFALYYASGMLNLTRIRSVSDLPVYDGTVLTHFVSQIISPLSLLSHYVLEYPPFIYAILTPLAFTDLRTAWLVWSTVSIMLIIGALGLVAQGEKLRWHEKLFWTVSGLSSFSFTCNIAWGNTGAYLTFLLGLFLVLLKHKRFLQAGLACGLCALKLQYLPSLVLVGCILGTWQFASGFLISGIFLVIGSLFCVGPQNCLAFLQNIAQVNTGNGQIYGHVYPSSMACLRGLLEYSHWNSTLAERTSLVAYLGSLCCLWFLWKRVYPAVVSNHNRSFELCASMSVLLMLAFSLHTYFYDCAALIVPYVWLYSYTKNEIRRNWKNLLLWLLIVLSPLVSWTMAAFNVVETTFAPAHFWWEFALLVVTLFCLDSMIKGKHASVLPGAAISDAPK